MTSRKRRLQLCRKWKRFESTKRRRLELRRTWVALGKMLGPVKASPSLPEWVVDALVADYRESGPGTRISDLGTPLAEYCVPAPFATEAL